MKKLKKQKKKFFSITETAQMKGVTRPAVWQAIKRWEDGGENGLPAKMVGTSYIIRKADVLDWQPRK